MDGNLISGINLLGPIDLTSANHSHRGQQAAPASHDRTTTAAPTATGSVAAPEIIHNTDPHLTEAGEATRDAAGDETRSELLGILEDCITSTESMAHTFFKEHCYRPFGKIHEVIFNILDNDAIRAAAICCPRGFGKTTLMGLVFPMKKILFRDSHYVILVSATTKKAINDLKTIARELQGNEAIKKVFGDMKGLQWAEGNGEIELNSNIKIEAKGAGSQIRGLKYGHYRPDLIIVDDLEDPEEVRNEDRRAQLKEWFFADLLNSIDLRQTRVVIIGTILHEDSLLANILDEDANEEDHPLESDAVKQIAAMKEKFHCVRLEACNDNFESNWPDYMSDAEIQAKAVAYEKRGLLDVFYREYRNLPIAKKGAAFESSFFKHYVEDFKELNKTVENVVIVDPSKTTNISSDYSAIVGVGFDSTKNKIYFRDCINAKLHPEEIYREACDMADRIGTCNIGIEVTSLNEFITYPFKSYIKTRGRYYNLIELKARGKKEDRIRALVPFYRMGTVYHNQDMRVRGPLETQLLSFPRSKYDDVMDDFAYAVEMFDLGERFFSRAEYGANGSSIEDEYKELEDLEPMAPFEGFRII